MRSWPKSFWILLLLLAPLCLHADNSFDLQGPKIDVHVKRGDQTLGIGSVPNLLAGDRLWVHPDLPESQSAHYVLVVAFLRGATNPPPPEWFTRVETWTREARTEGVFVTVPAEAQQALLFLVPETGGDFATLRKAVVSRPGAFVRAAQDLDAASWDRMRLETYLSEVKQTSQTDARSLKERAELAARSLGIRLDQQCFDKPSDQQAPCLTQHTEGIVLDDSNAGSLVEQWTSGSTRDLMNQLAYSPVGGAGAYSPYIGAIVDTARILSSLHTAHFQYIPALALPTHDTLNLRLSVPPSFRDPKSVVVIALPPVGPVKFPALHPVTSTDAFCAQKPALVLPAEGAPLVYSTQLARNLVLHLESKGGPIDLPVHLSASLGGLVLDKPAPLIPEEEITGEIRGKWGFDDWAGPRFHLHTAQLNRWSIPPPDQSALVVGRDDLLHISGLSSLCVDHLDVQPTGAALAKLTWKTPHPETLELTVPLKDAAPGPVELRIFQFGLDQPDRLTLKAYAEAAAIEKLTVSVGDTDAVLKGTRLDEVAEAQLGGIRWTPTALTRIQDSDQLLLHAAAATTALESGRKLTAIVHLHDGRELKASVIVDPPRPQVTLLSKGVQDDPTAPPAPVHLSSPDDLPLQSRLIFFLKSRVPNHFPRDARVDVSALDGSFSATLSLADGSLVLEDSQTAVATLEPFNRFGASAFGPLQLRIRSAAGLTGDWIPLGTLVRVPGFHDLRCPHTASKPCTLSGSSLYLIAAVSATPDMDNATEVPAEFTAAQLSVPHPGAAGALYLKLRDDPTNAHLLTLPITQLPPSAPAPALPLPATSAPAQPAGSTTPGDAGVLVPPPVLPAATPTNTAPTPATEPQK